MAYANSAISDQTAPLTLCLLVILHAFLSSAIFFKINFFEKKIREYNQTVSIQIRPNKTLGLIWIQTVCKSFQQMPLVGKELNAAFTVS